METFVKSAVVVGFAAIAFTYLRSRVNQVTDHSCNLRVVLYSTYAYARVFLCVCVLVCLSVSVSLSVSGLVHLGLVHLVCGLCWVCVCFIYAGREGKEDAKGDAQANEIEVLFETTVATRKNHTLRVESL